MPGQRQPTVRSMEGVKVSDEITIDVPSRRPSPAPPHDPVLDIRLGPVDETLAPLPDEPVGGQEPVDSSRRDRRLLALVSLVSVCALGLALLAFRRGDDQSAVDAGPTTSSTIPRPPAFSANVFATIAPSLVLIQTTSSITLFDQADDQADGQDDDEAVAGINGLGTGFIVNGDGSILTSSHVVEGADQLLVTFADGVSGPASIVFSDPSNDIAILIADNPPSVIVPAVLGDPARMRTGDEAYAVGNPLGLVGSMSAGVISGFDRSIPLPDGDITLDGLIQFDAAVNPGNSGGPLLNRNGEVIGVVTALANPTDQPFSAGIGFAVTLTAALGGDGVGPAQ